MRYKRWFLLGCCSILLASCSSGTNPSSAPPANEALAPATPAELIVGLWEPVEKREGAMEFTKDGQWINGGGAFIDKGTYRFLDGDLIETEVKHPGEGTIWYSEKSKVKVTKNDLTLTDPEDKQKEVKFKRSPLSSADSDVWSRPRGLILGVWQMAVGDKGEWETVEFTKYGKAITRYSTYSGSAVWPYWFVGEDELELQGHTFKWKADKVKVKVTKDKLVLKPMSDGNTEVRLTRKK